MSKRCSDCGGVKHLREFNTRTSRGVEYKMAVCKMCERIRQQGYYRLRKLVDKLRRR